jgi:hypothetical protein
LPPGKKWYSDPYGARLAARIALRPVPEYPRRRNNSALARTMRSRVLGSPGATSALTSGMARMIVERSI